MTETDPARRPPAEPPSEPSAVPPAPEAPDDDVRPSISTVPAASGDLDMSATSTGLPGAHHGGFTRPPTAPVAVPEGGRGPESEPVVVEASAAARVRMSGWALTVSMVGLLGSFLVGWGFPIGILAAVMAGISLRRPGESRIIAGWALALALLSIVYSAGWLLYSAGLLSAFVR